MIIIKTLAKEFEGVCSFLGENKKKCITFSVPIKMKLKELVKEG